MSTAGRRFASVVKRARAEYRGGRGRGLWLRLDEHAVYRRLLTFERGLAKSAPELSAKLPIELSLLTAEEADEYAAVDLACDADEVRRRLAQGHSCCIGRHDGEIVSWCWTATRAVRVASLGLEWPLAPDEVALYEAYTVPAFRGRNLATETLAYDLSRLRAAGFRRIVTAAPPNNRHILGPLDKTGFRPVGMTRIVKLGPWRHRFDHKRWADGSVHRAALPRNLRPPALASRVLLRARSELALLRLDEAAVLSRAAWGAAAPRGPYYKRGALEAVVLHHTAIPAAHLAGKGLRAEAAYIRGVQGRHRARGWFDIGYHLVVMPSGRVFAGRPLSALGAHVVGHNRGTVGIAVAGDFEQERPTPEALQALGTLLADLIPADGEVQLVGHRDLAETTCPGRFLYPVIQRYAPRSLAAT
jgi:ribosomal protein S18 acetylase RimI-like enzyme